MEWERTITSKQNTRIRNVKRLQQKKYRDAEKSFYIEGVRLVEEALISSSVECLFFSQRLLADKRGTQLIKNAQTQNIATFACTDDVLAEITETVHSQGVVAVVKKTDYESLPQGTLVVADSLQDPGNMGTLLRTALAAGVKGLYIVEGSVDLYNPKVLRSSMGAIFHLPHLILPREEILQRLIQQQVTIVVADLVEAEDFNTVEYPENLALVIGNEAHGLHERFRKQADLRVKIPLVGPVESLNASVAAGVLLYEILRQQRCKD